MSDVPFLFAIPLVAKSVARDWERACQLLSCTLDSILNQTNPNFKVALICHDVPDIPKLLDPRVVILKSLSPIPSTPNEQMVDKGHKKRLACAYLYGLGGGWIMLVDADDLVSNRIVDYVCKSDAKYGLLIDDGWEFDCVIKKMTKAPRFNRMCGTSAIFKFSKNELPSNALHDQRTLSDAFESHRLWRETSMNLGRPLDFVNFRAAIYTINNQQNHSTLMGPIGWKRKFTRLFSFSHSPTPVEIAEFSMNGLLS